MIFDRILEVPCTWRLFTFNVDCPTGHYQLDLSNPADYAVAEMLKMCLDRAFSVLKRSFSWLFEAFLDPKRRG